MASASIRDVAVLAGVSVGTVSNVLNGTRPVTPATAERVQDAIAQLGFVRNDAARQLRAGQSRTVGFTMLDLGNPFFTDVATAAEQVLADHGKSLIVGNSGDSADRESAHLDLFEEQRVAGLLITPVGDILPRLERLQSRGTPVVLVDRHDPAGRFSSVSVDDHRGGWVAASHLVEQGRRAIALLGGPRDLPQVAQRFDGATEALVGRADPPRELTTTAMTLEAGLVAVARLLEQPRRSWPDAIFAANDLLALGALQALTRAGVRVPDDLALIGYDDIYFAGAASIPLSSVRQPAEAMGRTAAELLLETDPLTTSRRQVVFEPTLVVRESSASR